MSANQNNIPPNSNLEVEMCLERIRTHKNVVGWLILNSDCIPIRTCLDNTATIQLSNIIIPLVLRAQSVVRDLDPSNELTFLRLRSRKNEIMVSPYNGYTIIVVQNMDLMSAGVGH